ncbi:MAG TPA: RedB protein [Planctomycetota bacterium]|nr:RedB protein [Planctomycetota bacterium]
MKKSALAWAALGALWFGGVAAGLGWLASYANRPGAAGRAPATWPEASAIPREPGRPTLLLFVHPRCSCSRASVAELAELLARAAERPATRVLFLRPDGVAPGWEQSELWSDAQRLPAASVLRDDGGAEAKRFGALTSGQALLYGADGRLLFAGGLTASRGHPGESVGRVSLLALLDHAAPPVTATPVFGCELFGRGDEGRPDADRDSCCDAK